MDKIYWRYLLFSLWRVINVNKGSDDVYNESDDGDQVRGNPHGHKGYDFVPPEKKMLNKILKRLFWTIKSKVFRHNI